MQIDDVVNLYEYTQSRPVTLHDATGLIDNLPTDWNYPYGGGPEITYDASGNPLYDFSYIIESEDQTFGLISQSFPFTEQRSVIAAFLRGFTGIDRSAIESKCQCSWDDLSYFDCFSCCYDFLSGPEIFIAIAGPLALRYQKGSKLTDKETSSLLAKILKELRNKLKWRGKKSAFVLRTVRYGSYFARPAAIVYGIYYSGVAAACTGYCSTR